jgi:ABC-type transport system involved in cytochrome c biogenesis permease subunit
MIAYQRGDTKMFNDALSRYQSWLDKTMPQETASARFEAGFNRFAPFYICTMLYCVAFVAASIAILLACVGEGTWSEALRRGAFWLLVFALILHTFGLIGRMWIQGRPPVTNLYSSAVFIGWGCVILGLLLEGIFRLGIGAKVAAITGFLTCIVAHNLAAGGDTLEMMQAVLDTNFWLATHVTTVTLGYTATFVAGFLGIVLILLNVAPPAWNARLLKPLSSMIYGVIAFATLLSFVGTVLGGIWADQSWGRFWGWDPKENGALLIVIWNAMILHARWAGITKARGIAMMAVGGNIVTSWSWFGTNMLGVGLHSYGFMNGAAMWLGIFMVSQLAVIGFGLYFTYFWRVLGRAGVVSAAAT